MEVGVGKQGVRMVQPMPGYSEVLVKSFSCLNAAIAECRDCGLQLSKRTLLENASLTAAEAFLFLICAVGWTLLRKAASRYLFQPLAHWCDLPTRDAAKMPESAWKLIFYMASWSYSTYLLFLTDYPFFHDPPSVFYEWRASVDVPQDIAIAYLAQCSFYGHAIYATVYMDAWRKDSVVMLVHHVITLALIAFSYAFRYHNVGILVLFLHDINDILLEFTKLNVYFKNRAGVRHRLNDIVSNIGCCTFAISWFWFRLYWFPLKVLYATCYSSLQSVPNIPFYFFFNILLLILTLMNIYWFLYIILLVVKVLSGQITEVNDVREYDIEDSHSPGVRKEYDHLHMKNSSKDRVRQRNGIVVHKRL
ncbi:ceramide synthase 1 isoform X1 [Scyliorhinus canicula]|uniref:ceramide synthase 1 isoform X1 n=2 Tax=Scyliorhinus canicula TaxID=7830 RepID=UPI0018F3D263|nr:ceramide synthase 1 isoform X1 [Scyliorhinus canicula]XP_038633934.1 ceramide synthase 1 isoform X1 [Scyliorhinus canicula]